MLANKTALIRRNTEVKEASTPVHEVRIKIVKDSKLFLKPETATRVAYMLERREMNGWGLGSLARALMALKGGALASRVSWNRAISLVHKNAPIAANPSKREEMPGEMAWQVPYLTKTKWQGYHTTGTGMH
eukprot:1161015-Pelagomonas_calceolata.AAC.2